MQSEVIQKKATLVGTEDYISPEILAQESSGMPADLWSLGVIIFMMISGRSPFKSANQINTFNNIANVQFSFTEDFSPEARDLISKLFQRDPRRRLGAGQPGSAHDFEALKSHPYFKGTDFNKIFLMQTPYNFKKFQRSTLRQQLMSQKQEDESNESILTTTTIDPEEELIEQTSRVQIQANIVLRAHLKKRSGLGFFNKRTVVLTDEPRLYYIKQQKDKVRHKHINLDPESTRLERIDKTKFKIVDFKANSNKKSNYIFRCHDVNECESWIMHIIQQLDKMRASYMSADRQAQHQFKQGSQS